MRKIEPWMVTGAAVRTGAVTGVIKKRCNGYV